MNTLSELQLKLDCPAPFFAYALLVAGLPFYDCNAFLPFTAFINSILLNAQTAN